MTHQAEIVGISILIGKEKFHGRGMRVVAAHAGELVIFPGRIGLAADRMDPADIVTDQDVLARGSFFMTRDAGRLQRLL